MARHRITTPYRTRLGVQRRDVRVVEAATERELHDQLRAAVEDVQARHGIDRVSGATSEPI